MKPCIDCVKEGRIEGVPEKKWRAASPPGPRCHTHARAEKKRLSAAAHGRHIVKEFGITAEQYALLLAYQSAVLGNPPGTCGICGRANGTARRLAVDHDHRTGRVRGLLCGPDNHDVLGRLDLAALKRAVKYLEDPPGKILLQRPEEIP